MKPVQAIRCRLSRRRELIIPKEFCDRLNLSSPTELLLTTDGSALIVTPLRCVEGLDVLRCNRRGRPSKEEELTHE